MHIRNGGQPVPKREVVDLPLNQDYLNFDTNIGIVATPVIDPDTSSIYVVAFSKTGRDHRFQLHAFDLTNGREKTEMNSPVTIEASYLGNGVGSVGGRIRFDPRKMLNRPALLLVNSTLYLAFTSHLDGEPQFNYHGWIIAYSGRTLNQVAVVNTTPDGIQGGIWQSGGGLAAEKRDGAYPLIYAVVSNGSDGGRNYRQSLMQLYPGELMSVKQAFIPANHEYLNDRDLDLSTAPVLIPDLPLAIVCVKKVSAMSWIRSDMRLVQQFAAGTNSCGGERPSNIHGAPVVWRNSKGTLRLYVWGEEDYMRAFRFDGVDSLEQARVAFEPPRRVYRCGMLSLSSNGSAEEAPLYGHRCHGKTTRTPGRWKGFCTPSTPRISGKRCGTAKGTRHETGWECLRSFVPRSWRTAKSIWRRSRNPRMWGAGGASKQTCSLRNSALRRKWGEGALRPPPPAPPYVLRCIRRFRLCLNEPYLTDQGFGPAFTERKLLSLERGS